MAAGDLSIDYAWGHPSLPAAKAAGYTGIDRYLSWDQSKNLTAAEVQEAHSLGMTVLVVWESTADRAAQGYQAGHDDAVQANQQADRLGLPLDRPIYFAVDFQGTVAQCQAYANGFRDGSKRPIGAYGSIDITDGFLANGTVRFGWQTCAWSRGLVSRRAHLYQRVAPTRSLAGSFDENVALQADYGQWPAPNTPAPAPADFLEELVTQLSDPLTQGVGWDAAASFVGTLYDKVLGTTKPDPDGFSFWTKGVASGQWTPGHALDQFVATAKLPAAKKTALAKLTPAKRSALFAVHTSAPADVA